LLIYKDVGHARLEEENCDIVVPRCSECASLGLVCEYGRPAWYYDDHRKQEQREINKRLIKEHRAMLMVSKQSLERARPASLPKPVGGSIDVSRPVS
jgi:Na+-translocating ferredoxin:NAD+ oxidoreductase RnfC subunit